MRRFLCFLCALLLSAAISDARPLELAHVFSDHAVLQRESSVAVWGWGEAGKTVTISASWLKKSVRTKVNDDGSWRVTLLTLEAGGPYSLTVKSGKEKIQINDILLGEVWLCSGQSNMQMPLSGFGFQEVEGATETIMDAPRFQDRIRVLNVMSDTTHVLQADIAETWEKASPGTASRTSAVAYFFAKRLTESLGVPVGIIVNAWGGSRIEPWMSRDAVLDAGVSDGELREIDALREIAGRWPNSVGSCWNGRMAPLAGYGIKGFLWYQGCSNIGQNCYDKLQAAMVRLWRESWGLGELPFIYALLAPYEHGDADGRWRPFFVETQLRTQELVSSVWAVSTETLGNKVTVHPAKKKEVADMMVLRALQNVYGMDCGVSIELPRLQEADFSSDGSVRVRLTEVWSNLGSISSREVTGFEIAGEDRQFHLANASIDWDGETIIVSCPEVPHPVAVRYGWRNWMGANLQKSNGIPVPPFRSDDWDY